MLSDAIAHYYFFKRILAFLDALLFLHLPFSEKLTKFL